MYVPRTLILGSSYSNIQTISNDPWTLASPTTGVTASPVDPWATVPSLTSQIPVSTAEENSSKQRSSTKTPESFLGENSSLVNLDNLLGTTSNNAKPGFFFQFFIIMKPSFTANKNQDKASNNTFLWHCHILASNPFLSGTGTTVPINPFVAQQRPSPSLNEMMNQNRVLPTGNPVQTTMQPPLVPVPASAQTQPTNPFC